MNQEHYYPTVWLSDIHLGYKDCKAEYLLSFLESSYIDTLYLVGDIIDIWALSKRVHWPKSHQDVINKLIQLSEHGTRVIYIPGNHDEPLRNYEGINFGNIGLQLSAIHRSKTGKDYLVIHGDQFDADVLCYGKWFAWIGDKAYDLLLAINRANNRIRKLFGMSYWSLAGHIKGKVKSARNAIMHYKIAGCAEVKRQNLDGIICGHIHHPERDNIDGIEYFNDGDWIENCSALTENKAGEMQFVFWTQTATASLPEIHSTSLSVTDTAAQTSFVVS